MKDLGIEMIQYAELEVKSSKIQVLAALLACRARVDKTEPDPKNLRVGWRADQLLQDIDALVVGQQNDPAAYAEIARQALAQYLAAGGNSPEIIALLRLAIFRGERLLLVSAEREESLGQMQGSLADFIQTLPDGTRNERCCSLFEYHRGVYFDAYGKFALAAEAQARAAIRADGFADVPGAAICRFVEAVYRLKLALVEERDTGDYFSTLEERFARLVEVTRGSAMEAQWGQGNGPWHMIQACVWLGKYDHQDWDAWVRTFLAAAKQLGQAFEPAAQLARAVDLDKRGYAAAETALLAVALDATQTNENRATALLVLARRALAVADPITAGAYLIRMSKQGTQHLHAVAARLFQ